MGFQIKQIYKRRPCTLEICPTGCDEGGYKSMDVSRRLYQWRAVGARVTSINLGKKSFYFHLYLYILETNSEHNLNLLNSCQHCGYG